MGIIEGRRLLNHKSTDQEINSLVEEYVNMQESGTLNQSLLSLTSVLTHEMSHTIGAKDHYHEAQRKADGSYTCVSGGICSGIWQDGDWEECEYANQFENYAPREYWCLMRDSWLEDRPGFTIETLPVDSIWCEECMLDIENYIN